MNEWHHQIALTARGLAAALTRAPGGADIDVALTARAAVLDHIAHALGELVPRTKPDRSRSTRRPLIAVEQVEFDPIGTLGAVLHGRTRPHLPHSPSELLDPTTPTHPATADWIRVGSHALLAGRAWPGDRVGTLGAEPAWRALAEIAALAQAVAVLDADLRAAAEHRPEAYAVLAATPGLRAVAGEVLILAAPTGHSRQPPAATVAAEHPQLTPAVGVAARGAARSSLIRGTGRLRVLLDQASEPTPAQIRGCAHVARDLCVLAAASATSITGADLRRELGDLARELNAGLPSHGEIALCSVPARALELQVRELHVASRKAFTAMSALHPDNANRLARRLPDLVELLADKARDQIEHRRWATPDRREDAPLPYALASCSDPGRTPPLLTALRQAVGPAEVLRGQLAHTSAGSAANSGLAAAVWRLRGIVQERGITRARSAHPAQAVPRRADFEPAFEPAVARDATRRAGPARG